MKNFILIATFYTCLAVSLPIIAQTNNSADDEIPKTQENSELTEQEAIAQAKQEAEAKAKDEAEKAARKSIKKDQVFIPTEEISEDKPVPFPVDI